jgi:hypothetical protein
LDSRFVNLCKRGQYQLNWESKKQAWRVRNGTKYVMCFSVCKCGTKDMALRAAKQYISDTQSENTEVMRIPKPPNYYELPDTVFKERVVS